jgi:putative membrane protein
MLTLPPPAQESGDRTAAAVNQARVDQQSQPARQDRTSDHLANERTLLAWIRTSIAIIVFGFVVARFGIALRQLIAISGRSAPAGRPGGSAYLGAAFVAIGVLFALGAWLHYVRTRAAIEGGTFRPTSRAGALLTLLVALFGAALIGYLLVTASSI